jgi:hypothetical protein
MSGSSRASWCFCAPGVSPALRPPPRSAPPRPRCCSSTDARTKAGNRRAGATRAATLDPRCGQCSLPHCRKTVRSLRMCLNLRASRPIRDEAPRPQRIQSGLGDRPPCNMLEGEHVLSLFFGLSTMSGRLLIPGSPVQYATGPLLVCAAPLFKVEGNAYGQALVAD